MDIEVVALDIDGTILDSNHQLSAKTIKTIKKVQQRGVKIVLATGRRIKTSLGIARALDLKTPLIAHNGTLVYDLTRKEVTYNNGFSGQEFKPFLDWHELEGLDCFLHFQDEIFLFQEPLLEWAINYLGEIKSSRTNIEPSNLANHKIFHRAILSGPEEKIRNYMASVRDSYASFRYITFQSNLCVATVLEILNSKASKGMALEHLANQWGIPREKILAVGDDINDLEMIQWAGTGVAMGNAVTPLKEAADMVCLDNSQEGIAALLENLIL